MGANNSGVGKPMRPDVALAFDRLAAAARGETGLFISVSSGFRSDAEQARLFAAQPGRQLFSAASEPRSSRNSSSAAAYHASAAVAPISSGARPS